MQWLLHCLSWPCGLNLAQVLHQGLCGSLSLSPSPSHVRHICAYRLNPLAAGIHARHVGRHIHHTCTAPHVPAHHTCTASHMPAHTPVTREAGEAVHVQPLQAPQALEHHVKPRLWMKVDSHRRLNESILMRPCTLDSAWQGVRSKTVPSASNRDYANISDSQSNHRLWDQMRQCYNSRVLGHCPSAVDFQHSGYFMCGHSPVRL